MMPPVLKSQIIKGVWVFIIIPYPTESFGNKFLPSHFQLPSNPKFDSQKECEREEFTGLVCVDKTIKLSDNNSLVD